MRRKKSAYDDSPGLFDLSDFDRENSPFEPLKEPVPEQRLRFMSFGSGSSGNCAYLGNDRFGILIDAGVEPDAIADHLLRLGISMDSIAGILLTHDHGDHVRYAYNFVRRYRNMRIFCTPKNLNGLLRRHNVSRRIKDFHQAIFKEFPFKVADFTIIPFETYHDGTDNVGFFIEYGAHRFVVATDMGQVSDRADFYIRQATHLMIEANYDLQMLLNGRYPEYLKARIISRNGHMDNEATAAYLKEIYTPQLRNVFLCHLSHDNNTPELAGNAIAGALTSRGATIGDASESLASREADVQLMILPRFEHTSLLTLHLKR